ncbi:MAG TPA: transcription termination factor Rho [Amycolatopsis sp.]|nr:transcription termination factor Rho [Amycolatopsis sp.]
MSNTDLLSGDLDTQAAPVASESGEAPNGTAPKRRTGGLSGMVIADLRELAAELGIGDTKGMRKGDLIAAIRERQGKAPRKRAGGQADDTLPFDGIAPATKQEKPVDEPAERPAEKKAPQAEKSADDTTQQGEDGGRRESGNRRRRSSNRPAGSPDGGSQQRADGGQRDSGQREGGQRDSGQQRGGEAPQREQRGGDQQGGERRQQSNQNRNNSNNNANSDDDEGGRRGRRFRDRRRRGGGRSEGGADTEIREDDVLLPVAGILDVLDNYAFVRTSGYLPGPNDVYVSLSLVRKYNLRRGDAITGVVKQPREGEQQRQKFNPLVRVDTINGLDPEQAKKRPEFTKLTPLYPNERLRLETEPHLLTTRVADLVMPVGKGQRALIVAPPKAGKTTILQDVANAIAQNNPECHLMVVLVDERPEEVTDMQRSVKGEVIASTFDRPPADHTSVAELSIERAKRLVEMGMDVVVLLDSLTRLGRAYNLAAPASGRILSGGVDSTALFPPKRFLGAARNIENGGSLTIFATTMVETGSTGDTVIFEEFKGTGNAELKLDRKISERRVFPAVDVNPSSTRKEELLLSPDELAIHHRLRRVLSALDSQQAIDLLLSRLRKTKTNIEFLMQVSKTALGSDED